MNIEVESSTLKNKFHLTLKFHLENDFKNL